MKPFTTAMFAIIAALSAACFGDEGPVYEWSGQAVGGAAVRVPVADRASVMLFLRPEQEQSRKTLEHLRAAGVPAAACIIIVSGERAAESSKSLAADQSMPVVLDPDFSIAGKFGVHVWPTTVLIRPDGRQAGHIGGLSDSFPADLRAYLDFAAGNIDQATLAKKLSEHQLVADGPNQRADRRLLVAARLLDAGQVDQAAAQIADVLAARPDDPAALFLRAQILLAQKEATEALTILDKLPAGSVPPWQLSQVRARALIALQRWDDARAAIAGAFKLNPNPADAHYLSGLIEQHAGNWPAAAEQFQLAYEAARGIRR